MTLTKSTYVVTGMTCSHCVSAVCAEIADLRGVNSVDVDLSTGTVRVVSDAPLDRDEVAAAVEAPGYALAGSAAASTPGGPR